MPSPFSHALVGMALMPVLSPVDRLRRPLLLGAACAVVPDVDVLGSVIDLSHSPLLGHRALTHSLCFAAVFAAAVTRLAFREPHWDGLRGRIWLYLAVATASHGLLDALTTYGQGVTLLAPVSLRRIKLPWQPITGSGWGLRLWWGPEAWIRLKTEVRWIWLPSAAVALIGILVRGVRRQEIPNRT